MRVRRPSLSVVAALHAACGSSAEPTTLVLERQVPSTTVTTTTTTTPTTAPSSTTVAVVAATATTEAPTTTTSAPQPPPAPRTVYEQAWTPFAAVGDVVLHHPSAVVERVGFHESNHDGAQQLGVLPTAADPVTLETRDRGTGSQTSADVVVDPGLEIRSPVTGTVLRAGTYVLYCDYSDDYVVIEPDARPGWEVKVLHVSGVVARAGQRVTSGETILAPAPTQLPFPSQVDEVTAQPPWPHVHIEVVDPTIPDRPGPGC